MSTRYEADGSIRARLNRYGDEHHYAPTIYITKTHVRIVFEGRLGLPLGECVARRKSVKLESHAIHVGNLKLNLSEVEARNIDKALHALPATDAKVSA